MMQLSQNRKKGKIGEVHAAAFLKRNGYTLLDRNYAYRGGELDIVAQSSSGTILFVEVKTVWNTKKGAPESRVNAQKKFRLWRTACHYLYTKKYPENTAVCGQRNQPPHPQKTAAGTSKSERLREQNACHMSKKSKILDTSSPICRKFPKYSTRHQPYVEIIQNLRHVISHMYTA